MTRPMVHPLALGLTLMVGLAACADETPLTPPDPITEVTGLTYGGGVFEQVIESNGLARSYTVVVPAIASGDEPAPLLLVYHDTDGGVPAIRALTGFDQVGAAEGWIVVYLATAEGSWAISRRSPPGSEGLDDLRFSTEVLDRVNQDLNVDPDRVFGAGFGEGGLMAQALACAPSSRIAAVAAVGTNLSLEVVSDCRFDQGVAALILAGTADPVHRFAGGRPTGTYGLFSAPGGAAWWAEAHGCGVTREILQLPNVADDGTTVERTRFQFCADGVEIRLYAVEGGGHAWPGSPVDLPTAFGLKSRDMDATQVITEFFGANPRT